MAEKSVHIPVTLEITKSYGVDSRRQSTGKASFGNIGENVPHYRRASIGSCHDFCKYGREHEPEGDGREHESEMKERRFISKRVTRKRLGQSSEESVRGTKMTSLVKLRASVDSKPQSAGPGQSSEESVRSMKTVDSKALISALGQSSEESVGKTKKTSVSNQRALLNSKPLISALGQSSEGSVGRTKKMSMGKLGASVDSKPRISDTSDIDKKEKPPKSLDSQKQVKNEVLVGRKKTSLVKVQTTSDLPKTISPTSKLITSPKWSSLEVKEIRLSGKHVTSSKSNSAIVKKISYVKPSKGFGGERNSELKMVKRASFSKVAAKNFLNPSRASFSPKPSLKKVPSINSIKHKSLKVVSHLKNQSKTRKDEPKHDGYNEVAEKTLYIVKMESENKTLQADENASDDIESLHPQTLSSPKFCSSVSQSSSQEEPEEPEYTASAVEEDSFPGDPEFEQVENGETLQVEEEGMPRKDGIACSDSEDMDCQMLKSKFRRGNVVETDYEENSPRRLNFRRGKVLEENEHVEDEAQRKSFKERDGAGAVSIGTTSGTQKVVLRRQDVLSKDAQGLFNNVIEETASKLAEARRSKVKALVGAFETVISLQERKPSANTVS